MGCVCSRGQSSDENGIKEDSMFKEYSHGRIAWDELGNNGTNLDKQSENVQREALFQNPQEESIGQNKLSRHYPDVLSINIRRESDRTIKKLEGDDDCNVYKIRQYSQGCQTDPIPENAFDLYLSDKNDIETQTLKKSYDAFKRYYDDETVKDAIIQTDQRLVFLLKRSASRGRYYPRLPQTADASVQTVIDSSEIGVQVNLDLRIDVGHQTDLEGYVEGPCNPRKLCKKQRSLPKKTCHYSNTGELSSIGVQTNIGSAKITREILKHSSVRKITFISDFIEPLKRADVWSTSLRNRTFRDIDDLHERLTIILSDPWAKKLSTEALDLIKVRLYFRWIAENIRYDSEVPRLPDLQVESILQRRSGLCFHFVKFFEELCNRGGIRVKCIQGYAKNADYEPRNKKFSFVPERGPTHAWNVVFLDNSWRLLDCAWGAIDEDSDTPILNEHFFLTDPDEFIFSHIPYNQFEENYSQWQLLEVPLTLKEFNDLPVLTSSFFEYNLKLLNDSSPMEVREKTEMVIRACSILRYEWKFYSVDDTERDESHRNEILCYLKGRRRLSGYFQIRPKHVGSYYLKLYAKPEHEIVDEEDDTLDHIATILIRAVEVKVGVMDWPRIDVPWGLTRAFSETGAYLVNQTIPIITMTCGLIKKLTFLTPDNSVIMIPHMYDAVGNELLLDRCRDFQYAVLLSKRNPIPNSTLDNEECSLCPYIRKEETDKKIDFLIHSPSKVGHYKLQIYGAKKPPRRGKYQIPLISSFLIEVKDAKTLLSSRSFEPPRDLEDIESLSC